MIDLLKQGRAKFPWWPDWRGECVAVIGGGPSAKLVDLDKLRDRIHCIVINESFQLCPWAEFLYSCDAEWWRIRQVAVKKFKGMKIGYEVPADVLHEQQIKKIKIAINEQQTPYKYKNEMLFDEAGVIGSGFNSGFQTINLSAQFGCTGIALIGFDLTRKHGIHWHGGHQSPLRNPDEERLSEWRILLDSKADQLAAKNIDVVNCSESSTLTAFPKMTIEQMLERWGL